ACHRTEKAFLLRVGSPAQDHLRRERVVNAHHHRDRRVDGRDLLERHEVREHVEAEPIVLLREEHPEKPKITQLRDDRGLEGLLAIPLIRERRDLALRELARDALNLALLFIEWS